MGTVNPRSNPNPNPSSDPSNGKDVYHIGGIPVRFPYQPYGSQFAFMGRVISTLDRARRDGHSHALLESPTGTGKSLSLLCSTLAWQQNFRPKNLNANPPHSKPNPEALSDPINHGGGFIPETQSSSISESEGTQPAPTVENGKTKVQKVPTIFYASRTHSQISQLIREYRKTAYRVPMAILASRKHYCTNPHVRQKENVDEECKLLLKDEVARCPEFRNYNKVIGHPSLQKGGCHEAHDIEDLVRVGEVVKGCSYYAACSMAENAQLVFCPYSYIINPVVRGAVNIDIKGAIVILDEAHNIEDMARDAGSIDIEEEILHELQMELGQLCLNDVLVYQPLLDMTEGIISWMQRRKSTLERREFQHYYSCWTGEKAQKELQEASISLQSFPILQECAKKAIQYATDKESDVPHLGGLSVTTLEGVFSSLSYFFSGNGLHTYDYQLSLQRYIKKDVVHGHDGWVYTFSLWCLNPAVVFRGIADLSLSVILTSGTLSPMASFSSELGVHFGTCLEAPHVIDAQSQLWAAVISSGPGNYPLNASYKTADAYAFQDALGTSLEEIFKIVPGGSLVFFPSYKLMEKLCVRWRETGQWSRLNAKKSVFVEPRRGSQDDLESVLKCYYDCVGGRRRPVARKRREKKINNYLEATGCEENCKKDGAAFLAVCRGKVSEGIDFSDENARAVIIVGIPFPNIYDIQVNLKKKYNDTYKSQKNLLSGSDWYCYQAFRALNQAAGRCIRHRFDYGAIILLDQRFREERNTAYISKWLRKSIRRYDSFEMSLQELKSFYKGIKVAVPVSMNEGLARIKNQKSNKGNHFVKKAVSNCKVQKSEGLFQYSVSKTICDANSSQMKSQGNGEIDAPIRIDDSTGRDYINLESDTEVDLSSSMSANRGFFFESQVTSIVKESPATYGSTNTSRSLPQDDNVSSTMSHPSTEFQGQLFCSMSLASSCEARSNGMQEMTVTPDRNVSTNTTLESESSLSLSVNSHYQKKRKIMGSPVVNILHEASNAPDINSSDCATPVITQEPHHDASCRTYIDSEPQFQRSTVSQPSLSYNGVPCTSSTLPMDKKLQIFCFLCRNPLGHSKDKLPVTCSLTSLSRVHLSSFLRVVKPSQMNTAKSTNVLISETSSIDKRLLNGNIDGSLADGICSDDGCEFSTIFCPFCSIPNYCLGVHVRATDASNAHLLNKILFYVDRLHIKTPEPAKDEDSLPISCSKLFEIPVLDSIEKFSYSANCQNSGGWRTTKSKLRLPKRSLQPALDKYGSKRT